MARLCNIRPDSTPQWLSPDFGRRLAWTLAPPVSGHAARLASARAGALESRGSPIANRRYSANSRVQLRAIWSAASTRRETGSARVKPSQSESILQELKLDRG